MLINVFSYKEAVEACSKDPSLRKNWISIRDVGYDYFYRELDELCKNILILKFDDVTGFDIERNLLHPFYKEVIKSRDFIRFDEDMADRIIAFAKDIKTGPLNIHCWAGVSRSQAIGFCLNTYFNLYAWPSKIDYITNLKNSIGTFKGNPDVIRILTERIYKGVV